MTRLSRRTFVGAAAGGTAAVLAGCAGGDGADGTDNGTDGGDSASDDGDDGGTDLPAYSRWLPADHLDGVEEVTAFHVDLQRVLTEWPEEAREELDFGPYADELGIDEEDLDGMLVVSRGDGADPDVVITGSFERDPVVESLSGGTETDEYGEYEVVQGLVAVGPGAIVVGPAYGRLIDAREGSAERLTDVDDRWADVLANVGGASVSMVTLDPAAEFEIMGVAVDAEGDSFAATTYSHFADEAAAEAGREAAEEETREQFDDGEVTDVRVEGTVVVVEAEIDDLEWSNDPS